MIAWPTRNGRPPGVVIAVTLGLALALIGSCLGVGLTPWQLARSVESLGQNWRQIVTTPDWGALGKLLPRFGETLAMAVLASLIAGLLAAPLAFIAARRTTFWQPFGSFLRWVISVARAIPDIVWAIAFVSAFGLGPVAGTAALVVTTLSFLVKFLYESLDVAPLEPQRGVEAHGAGWLATRFYGILPSAMPDWVSHFVYSIDSNVRSASILGFVGAGGIGFDLAESVRVSRYDRLGLLIVGIFLIVGLLDVISDAVRRRVA